MLTRSQVFISVGQMLVSGVAYHMPSMRTLLHHGVGDDKDTKQQCTLHGICDDDAKFRRRNILAEKDSE